MANTKIMTNTCQLEVIFHRSLKLDISGFLQRYVNSSLYTKITVVDDLLPENIKSNCRVNSLLRNRSEYLGHNQFSLCKGSD